MCLWTLFLLLGVSIGAQPLFRSAWLQCHPTCYVIVLLLIIGLLIALRLSLRLAHPLCRKTVMLLLALTLGFSWVALAIHSELEHRLPKNLEGKTLLVQGVIASIPVTKLHSISLLFQIRTLNHSQYSSVVRLPMKVRLSWYGKFPGAQRTHTAKLKIGDAWMLAVRLKRPHGFKNPGGFDYETWLMQQRISATGYVYSKGKNILTSSSPWSYPIGRMRELIAQHIGSILKNNSMKGLILALSVGERSSISQTQWQVFRATGTSHLMAISGLHIGLAAGFFYFAINFLWRRMGTLALWLAASQAASIAALLGAITYSAMAGFSLSTERALIMIAVFMSATLFRRALKPMSALFIALLFILAWDPFVVLSPGFWLSFGAVGSIIFGMSLRLNAKSLWWRVGRVQWVVTLGLAPLTLFIFHQASLGSLGTNFVAIPWVGFIVVPLTLSGSLLTFISPHLAEILIKLAATSLNLLWNFLVWSSHLPHFVWNHVISHPIVFISAQLGAILLIAPRGLPGRWLGIICLLPLFMIKPARPEWGELWFTLLDVGQGLSAVIETHGHTLVYDTGPRYSDSFNAGDAVLIPFLKYRGLNKIDTLVISHGDNDHIGGAQPLLKAIPTTEILTSVVNRFPNQNTKLCRAGQHWEWEGVKFKMLFPTKAFMNEDNNSSCVLAVSVGDEQILLTGDIEALAERYLVKYAARHGTHNSYLKSSILIAPHHGSITSSTVEFVHAVDPKYVLFPVGYRNRFHFPSRVVVARYGAIHSEMYRTDREGAITVKMSKHCEEVRSSR